MITFVNKVLIIESPGHSAFLNRFPGVLNFIVFIKTKYPAMEPDITGWEQALRVNPRLRNTLKGTGYVGLIFCLPR